jgi:uncharacterized protein YutE (UPF0331/DUF86 family)
MNSIIISKASVIENCISRIQEEYVGYEDRLSSDNTRQDSIILNIQRAVQAVLDMGSHIIKEKKWGVPQSNRDIFEILEQKNIIESGLAANLKKWSASETLLYTNIKN